MAKKVVVILAEGAEEMETTITVDVLRRGGVEVVVAGLAGGDSVECSRGVRITPDAALETLGYDDVDAVVLPGGAKGAQLLAGSQRVGDLLRDFEKNAKLVAAICAAPIALTEHGAFEGYEMTSHPSVEGAVSAHGKYRQTMVVEDRNLITSRGPGTAFEFALKIVERLEGKEKAESLKAPMMLE